MDMDIETLKNEAFREAIAELKQEFSSNLDFLTKLERYEKENGIRKTPILSD